MCVQIKLVFLLFTLAYVASTDEITHNPTTSAAPTDLAIKPFKMPLHCRLPLNYGSGDSSTQIDSWYYDHESGRCEQFLFLGGGGNPNRFESETDCLTNCTGDPCRRVKIAGITFGALALSGRYLECTYNMTTKNDNCPNDYYCSDKVGVCCRQETFNICDLPKAEGVKANEHMESRRYFFYNRESGLCEPFLFNGVGGNQNRFRYKMHCDLACAKFACPNEHRPYSKLHGPIYCAHMRNRCPYDYSCIDAGIPIGQFCCPIGSRPQQEEEEQQQEDVDDYSSLAAGKSACFVIVALVTFLFTLQ